MRWTDESSVRFATGQASLPGVRAAVVLCCAAALLGVVVSAAPLAAQRKPVAVPAGSAVTHRTRLILKDGSFQTVMSYRVAGDRVQYVSADRGGAQEEIPAGLIDWPATQRWETQHMAAGGGSPAPVIDPELVKEEADRAALTPSVAPDLRLPEQDSVLALDTFQGTPELVPLAQSDGDLNRNTAHNILRATINPLSTSHQLVQLKGTRSLVQLHVNTPDLYLRLGDDFAAPTGGTPLKVETHNAKGDAPTSPTGGSPDSRYAIVRADVRTDSRIVASFNINMLGSARQHEDIVDTTTEVLPGGHWMKISPRAPLTFGEYALMEIISDKAVNLGVWDFGVHPTAPENGDAIRPEPKRGPATLERRRPK